jgi:hypothetical protein
VVLNFLSARKSKNFTSPEDSKTPKNANLAGMPLNNNVAVVVPVVVMAAAVVPVAAMVATVLLASCIPLFVPLAVSKPRFRSNPMVLSLSIAANASKAAPLFTREREIDGKK